MERKDFENISVLETKKREMSGEKRKRKELTSLFFERICCSFLLFF
jgi:hypothetical protein